MKERLSTLGTFLLAAALVYLVGAALLAAWPMWTMMGFGGTAWMLALGVLLLGLVVVGLSRLGAAPASRPAGEADGRCPECAAAVKPDYVLCPECHASLGTVCPACGRGLRSSWARCPYCGSAAETPPAARPTTAAEPHS